jgi:flagellar protein FliO/FliZ
MMSNATLKTTVTLSVFLLLPILFGFSDASAAEAVSEAVTPPTGVTNTDLWAPTLRMILGLGGVLVVLGVLAFIAKRLRQGNAFKSGMIEIVSGVSLGGREKVVLLRVGEDEILVGMSPSGMRPLHVMHRTVVEPAEFDTYMGKLES